MFRKLQFIVAAVVCAASAYSQQEQVTLDGPYQLRYASNLNLGDSVINITNSGARGAAQPSGTSAAITGALCVSVYMFSPDEQMVACCSCPVTPNGLITLSARLDMLPITLTPAVPTAVVVKLMATVPVGGTCVNSAFLPGPFASGMVAWGTTLHSVPNGSLYGTETRFSPATLSAGEFLRLTQVCGFIYANGSGFGICRSCRIGGLGAVGN